MQLARLAAFTTRVRVGTSALLLPLYAPAIVAKQVANLDRLSGGRVTLGVGVGGEDPQEFEACEVPIGERGARTDEAIPLLRRLWSAEEVSHQEAVPPDELGADPPGAGPTGRSPDRGRRTPIRGHAARRHPR